MLVNLEIINGNPKTIIEYCKTEFPNGLIPEKFLHDVFRVLNIDIKTDEMYTFILDKEHARLMLDESGETASILDSNKYNFYCHSWRQTIEEFQKELNKIHANNEHTIIKLYKHVHSILLYQAIYDYNWKEMDLPDICEINNGNMHFTIFRVDKETGKCRQIESINNKLTFV